MGDSIRDRVERGAALLDTTTPDWCMGVSFQRLSMVNCTECVLGQLYGHYSKGVSRLLTAAGSFDGSASHGFSITDEQYDLDPPERTMAWRDLKDEWMRVIVLRRSRRDGWTKIEGDTNG